MEDSFPSFEIQVLPDWGGTGEKLQRWEIVCSWAGPLSVDSLLYVELDKKKKSFIVAYSMIVWKVQMWVGWEGQGSR